MDRLASRAVDLGARVDYNSRALTLIVDEANAVKGLVVRIDGKECCVRAQRGVILCSGGFACNDTMLRQYAPGTLACRTPITAGNDYGAGIRMGISVGAAAIHMEQFFCTMPFYPPESLVKGIFVNDLAQRFVNEDAYHGRVTQEILRQRDARAWLIVDNEIFDRPVITRMSSSPVSGDSVGRGGAGGRGSCRARCNRPSLHSTPRRGESADPLFHKQSKWAPGR
jgi:3-oxo-5alpha-steroid 4-dehydrogenase